MSLFHSELFRFLLESSQKQIAEEGINPSGDPQLQALLKQLASKNASSLNEVVDRYQSLFQSKTPVLIEKNLREAFPIQVFVALGLTRYYPRIYRGLPRFYHRDQVSESRIKSDFSHLPSLKKEVLNRSLFSLYGKIPCKGKVTLFTWVMNDGLGDLVAAVEVMRLLKGRLPHLDLHFVALAPTKALSYLNLPESSIIIPYEKECPLSAISEEAFEMLRSSDLILQIPTYYPHTNALIEKFKETSSFPKMECVGEYGFLESSWFHPKSGNHCLGLHFLEKGILTRKPCQAEWKDVTNDQIHRWRIAENHFYLAYLASSVGGGIYLHSLLKSLENDPKGIDLCVPDLGWFFQFLEKQKQAGRPLLEWEMGVASIQIYYKEQVHEIQLAPEGKKVRFLCPDCITQSDFRALLALSGEWVAVRGNQSFSEAVSQGKAFFYDGRGHSRYFIKDLSAVAENRIANYPSTLQCIRGISQGFVYNLPIQEEEWVEETFFQELEDWTSIALQMGLALQDPDAVTGYKALNRILVEEFSANSFLCHLVQRALCHKERPDLEYFEREQVEKFIAYEQTFSELIQNQRGILGECSLA